MAKAPTSTKETVSLPNAAYVGADSQPAMTARNNGDGTWSVTAGPGGEVLQDGLAYEQAVAIVGGQTGAHKPADAQERKATNDRVDLEQKLFDGAAATQLKPDETQPGAEHLENLPVAVPTEATITVAADPARAPAAPNNGGE